MTQQDDVPNCPVCSAAGLTVVTSPMARHADCRACHHRIRLGAAAFDYRGTEMGGRMNGAARLRSQLDFFGAAIQEDASILEIGCAAGQLAAAVRAAHPKARYAGIELSPAGRHAAEIVDRLYDRPLEALLRVGEIGRGEFDLIVCSHVLEHIPDIQAAMAAMAEALAPGGAVFVEVPSGSGHPALYVDENPSHLHFFSVCSLSRLMAAHGLKVMRAETGAFHDARYPDSLRVLVRPASTHIQARYPFSDELQRLGVARVAVWGAGKLAEELLSTALRPQDIAFFVDRDPKKHGQRLMGCEIRPLTALHAAPDLAILVSSLDYEDEIAAEIARDFQIAPRRIVTIRDLLERSAMQRGGLLRQ